MVDSPQPDPVALHAEAIALIDALVAQVAAADLARPTPCADWTVGDLLAHEIGQHLGFAAAARHGDAPESAYEPVAFDDEAWSRSVAELLGAFAEADPTSDVLERELAPFPLPFGFIVGAQLLDVLAHTWDLARALGREFEPPAHLAAEFLAIAQNIPDTAYGEGQAFGERFATDGSIWEQGLRLLGRDPEWALTR
jgi:uncharacterized protein (TIGR03086 family)